MIEIIIYMIGVIILLKRNNWVPFYYLSIMSMLFPIYSNLNLTHTFEGLLEDSSKLNSIARNYILIAFFYNYLRCKKTLNLSKFYMNGIWIFLFLIFNFIWSVYHNSFNLIISSTSEILTTTYLFFYLFLFKPKVKTDEIIMFSIIFLVIQSFCVILEVFGYPILSAYRYEKILFTGASVVGTFIRFNALGNYLSTFALFVILEYYSENTSKKQLLLAVYLLIIILLTGAKISCVLFFVFLLYSSITKYKYAPRVSFTIVSLLMFVSFFLFTIDLSGEKIDQNVENGIQRQIYGIASLINKSGNETDISTTAISIWLIYTYFPNNFIMGCGLGTKGDYGYSQFIDTNTILADARLSFQLVEYGIIGFSILILYFVSIFTFIKKNVGKSDKHKILIVLIYLLILTITETGIFTPFLSGMAYLYTYYLYINNHNYENINRNNLL